jgi:hypothetical protein
LSGLPYFDMCFDEYGPNSAVSSKAITNRHKVVYTSSAR